MSTQKTFANPGRSRVASYAAVTRCVSTTKCCFLVIVGRCRPYRITAKPAKFPSSRTASAHWPTWGDPDRVASRGARPSIHFLRAADERARCSIVPLSCSITRNRRGPVFSNECRETLPAWVSPVRDVIGEGTMNWLSKSRPCHCLRGRVSKFELVFPQQRNGLPGKSKLTISSVCESPSAKLMSELSQRSTSFLPIASIISLRRSRSIFGHFRSGTD